MQIQQVCDFIQAHASEKHSLASLAAKTGLSPYHFHRTFKSQLGVTPMQFAESCRLRALKSALRGGTSVTDAVYEAGFGSSSRVYERSDRDLGMTPAQYRSRGEGIAISYAMAALKLGRQPGRMLLGATDRGLCFLQFADSDAELLALLHAEYPRARIEKMPAPYSPEFQQWMRALQDYLAGRAASADLPLDDLPLDLRATAFQTQVWNYLRTIPSGAVCSYADVARGIGKPAAVRAVARSCGTNPIALVIPCHRVIRGDGGLGGYRWGIERKQALLDLERKQ